MIVDTWAVRMTEQAIGLLDELTQERDAIETSLAKDLRQLHEQLAAVQR
jgi:hypothetical protein